MIARYGNVITMPTKQSGIDYNMIVCGITTEGLVDIGRLSNKSKWEFYSSIDGKKRVFDPKKLKNLVVEYSIPELANPRKTLKVELYPIVKKDWVELFKMDLINKPGKFEFELHEYVEVKKSYSSGATYEEVILQYGTDTDSIREVCEYWGEEDSAGHNNGYSLSWDDKDIYTAARIAPMKYYSEEFILTEFGVKMETLRIKYNRFKAKNKINE